MSSEYYTDQEKSILINFFIKEGKNCNVEFKDYLTSFVKKYGQKMYDKHPGRRVNSVLDELGNYEYESPPYVWGNENNDNLVTYVFSQPGFVMTTGKVKNLKKLKVNWHHINNEGNNFLFYIKMSRIEQLKELIEEKKIQTDLINNNGEVFYYHIFKNYRSASKELVDCYLEDARLIETMDLLSNNNELMDLMTKEKIEELKNSFHECVDVIEKKLYEVSKKYNKGLQKSYEEDAKNNCLPFKEHREHMNKFFNYNLLNKKLVIDENRDKVKKMKI